MVPGEKRTGAAVTSKTMPLGAGIPDPAYKPIASPTAVGTARTRRVSASGGSVGAVLEDS